VANVRAQDSERHDARLISGPLTLPDLHLVDRLKARAAQAELVKMRAKLE